MDKDRQGIRLIFLTYIGSIFLFAFILMLPISNKVNLGFVDALFTASSAISCTGLIVKSTPMDFTVFGQVIIILMIQLGGFGYISMAVLLSMVLGKRLSYNDRMALKDSYEFPTMSGIVRFLRRVFLSILVIEAIGAILLSARFSFDFGFKEALWLGAFHAISAFNNAGFSLFDTSMMDYKGDLFINIIICSLIIIGGLGYMVVLELYYLRIKIVPKLSNHTKTVLYSTLFLILLGMLLVYTLEFSNPKTLGELSWYEQLLTTFFTSVNFRTSGFNSLDVGSFSDSLLFFSTAIMIIGGAPGGTAGGIKITTFVVLSVTAWYFLRGEAQPRLFSRAIPTTTIYKALSIAMVTVIYVCISTIIVVEIENRDFVKIFFELISAFATVGISVGDGGVVSYSALFSDSSKIIVALLMFMGKIGVITFSGVILGQTRKKSIKYPEGSVIL